MISYHMAAAAAAAAATAAYVLRWRTTTNMFFIQSLRAFRQASQGNVGRKAI